MRFNILLLALVLHQSCLLCKAYPPTYSGEPPTLGDTGGGGGGDGDAEANKHVPTISIKYVTKSVARAQASPSLSSSSSSSSSSSTIESSEEAATAELPKSQPAFVYEASLPTQNEGAATTAAALSNAEHDGELSKKIIGSSVVTSVSVILNGNEPPQFMDAIGHKVPKPMPSLQVASPINLLNPDRYEFYTFDDKGELVKRLMTMQEIQSIVANGDGEGPSIIHTAPILDEDPEKNVEDIVNSVQNVLNKQVESTNNLSTNAVPHLDTPDVSSSWSMILPAIFGNTGDDIFPPQKPQQQMHMTPDSDLMETSTRQPPSTTRRPKPPKRKPAQKRKTTTTSTTEMPNTPQIVQEDLAPHESVYTGIEQYQSMATNMKDFDVFSTMDMQPIYHKLPEAEIETTTRRVFVNNQEVIRTEAPAIVKSDEIPDAAGKTPSNTQLKHGPPPHRRRPGASANKQKIKKKPQQAVTTKPPTPTLIPTTTPTTTTTTTMRTTTPTTTTTTTTTTTPAPTTTPLPTSIPPVVVTVTASPPPTTTTAPPKKKKKPTRPQGAQHKPQLVGQKRKPHPQQTTPHHRPRPTQQQHPYQQQQQQHHKHQQQQQHQQQQPQPHPTQMPDQHEPQYQNQHHHHQQYAQYPQHQQQQQPTQPPQLPQPVTPPQEVVQVPQRPIIQDQQPQQYHHKHPAYDSSVDSNSYDQQPIYHNKHRPRPTKGSTTTAMPITTPTATIPTLPTLASEIITTTTPSPIQVSLDVASERIKESEVTKVPIYPVHSSGSQNQAQASLESTSEETDTTYLKTQSPLQSLSMVQQQLEQKQELQQQQQEQQQEQQQQQQELQQQQQHQEQQPQLTNSEEDLNTKLSFDQIMLSLKQDESKDVEKPIEEVKFTTEQIKESETTPIKYDSAENMQALEDMADKLKKPVLTITTTTLSPVIAQIVETPETSPSSMLFKETLEATTAGPTTTMPLGDVVSDAEAMATTVASAVELESSVKVAAASQETNNNEGLENVNNEEETKLIVKETLAQQENLTATQPERSTELPLDATIPPKLTSHETEQFTTNMHEIVTTQAEELTAEPMELTTMTPVAAPTTHHSITTSSNSDSEQEIIKLPSDKTPTESSEQQENASLSVSLEEHQSLVLAPTEDQSHVVNYEPLYADIRDPIITELTTTELPESQTNNYDIEDSNEGEDTTRTTDEEITTEEALQEAATEETLTATTNTNLRLPVYTNVPQQVESLIAENDSETEQPQVVDLVQHLNPGMVQPTEKISMTEFQTQAATVASALVGGPNTVVSDVGMYSGETKDELALLMSDVIKQITNDQKTYQLPPVQENENRLSNFAQFNTSFWLKPSEDKLEQADDKIQPSEEKPQSTDYEEATTDQSVEEDKQSEENEGLHDDSSVTSIKAEQLIGTTEKPSLEIDNKNEQSEENEMTVATLINEDEQNSYNKLEALIDSQELNEQLDNKSTAFLKIPAESPAVMVIEGTNNEQQNQLEINKASTPTTQEEANLEEVGSALITSNVKTPDEKAPDVSQLLKIVNTEVNSAEAVAYPAENGLFKFSKLESSAVIPAQAVTSTPSIANDKEEEQSTDGNMEDMSDNSTEDAPVALDEETMTEASKESSASDDGSEENASTDKPLSLPSPEQQEPAEESKENQSTTEEEADKEDAQSNATQPQPQIIAHPDEKKDEEDEIENATTILPDTKAEPLPLEQTKEQENVAPSNIPGALKDSDSSANVELISNSQQFESDSVEESSEIPSKIITNSDSSSSSDDLTAERYESATETSTEDELTATLSSNDDSLEIIDNPYLKLGELNAKPTIPRPAEFGSTQPQKSSPEPIEEEQTTFEHMENNYDAIVNGHQGKLPSGAVEDSATEQDEEDDEDQGGYDMTTQRAAIAISTTNEAKVASSSSSSTTTTTQKPLVSSTTPQPTTTTAQPTTTASTTTTTTKRINTLKPVSYFKQPAFSLYNQYEPPRLPTYPNPSPSQITPLIQQRPMQRPPSLTNLMHSSPQATRPPVKLEPNPGYTKGLEASIAHLDDDLVEFGKLCNELAFSYWKSITSEKISSARSLIISPFALTSMLSMVFLGARGGTSGEMNEVLRLDDMVTFNPHLVFKNITESVEKATDSDIATAAFVREIFSDRANGKILQFFKEKTHQLYSGHVEEVNFHVVNDIIRRRTNLLVKRHTMGKVLEYLRTNSVWVNGPLATISANLFQTDCQHGSTHERDGEMFFQVNPTVRQRRLVPIPAVLYKSGFTAGYEPKLDATVVAFGRIEDTVSTIYVMPGHQSSISPVDNLDRLERELVDLAFSENAWSNILTSVMDRPGMEVQLPRFSHRSFINASLGLQKMGLKGLFKSDLADLRGLTGSSNRDIFLSDMIQINTFSTCGEEKISDHHHVELYPAPPLRKRNKDVDANDDDDFDSSEAIIDFGSLVQDSALGRGFYDDLLDPKFLELPLPLRPRQARVPDTPRLRFDKPFLYFVRHNPTGMILFMGRFNPRLLP